jgi:hypothetical protein
MPIAKPPFPRLQKGHPLAQGLRGAWLFAEGSINTAIDSSGCEAHGAGVAGMSSNQWFPGPSGWAYHTAGSMSFALGTMPHFKAVGPVTVSALTKEHSYATWSTYFQKGYDGATEPLVLRSNGGNFTFQTYNPTDNGIAVTDPNTHSLEVWYHVVGTFDGAKWALYVNGALVASVVTTTGPTDNAQVCGLLASYVGGPPSRIPDADVDHVMLWQRGMSAKEVADLYADPYAMFRPTRLRKKPGAAAYVLTAAPGALTFTGNAANLVYHRVATVMPAAPAAFTLTGVATTLTYTPKPPAAVSRQYVLATPNGGVLVHETNTLEFTVYGTQVSATAAPAVSGAPYTLTAATGAFTLAAPAVALRTARVLSAAIGAFTLTGISTGFITKHGMSVATGMFTLAGTSTGLRAARRIDASQVGSLHLFTGYNPNLVRSRALPAATGALVFSGKDAGLVYGSLVNHYTLPAAVGGFILTGQAVGLRAARRLSVTAAAFTLAGTSTGLLRGRVLTAAPGAFVLTGNAANLIQVRKLTLAAGTGAFTLTGYGAGLVYHTNAVLLATPVSFVFSGSDTGLIRIRNLPVGTGQFVFTGTAAVLRRGNYKMPAERIALRFTGYDTFYRDNDFHLPDFGDPGALEFGRKMYAIPGRW